MSTISMFFRRFLRRRFHSTPLTRPELLEAEHLISESSFAAQTRQEAEMQPEHNRKGSLRAYWLGAVVCMAGFLFGYDSGIVGGVLTLPSFIDDYGFSASAHSSRVQSLTVSLQQLGAFVACFLIWPITHAIGRRKSLMICSAVFSIGAIVETINTGSLAAFWVARVIAGLGLGGATVVVPMFSSEMAPSDLRGRIGCFFQLFFTIGILISYWVDYGVKIGLAPTSRQWQIPIGLQLVPAAILGLGMFTLKESVRWYVQKGMYEEAWDSLTWIRASNGPAVQAEMAEIRAGVELEARETADFKFKELLEMRNFKLISASILIFTAQQATGATAFAYYAPQYFSKLAGNNVDRNLLLTGIFGAVKVVACATFVWLLSERLGRRLSFIYGAAFMAVIFYITAAINKTIPPPTGDDPPVSASGKATVALIYLFVIVYNMTWGPLPWPYVSEIFPTRIREPGIAAGVAAQWFFNFVFTLTTPYMINNIGWGTFLVWAVFNTVIAVGSAVSMRETRGKTLEEINADFSGQRRLLNTKARTSEDIGQADTDEAIESRGETFNRKGIARNGIT